MEQLGDNTSLTVELRIKFNGSSSDDAATVFPLRTYTVRAVALAAPTLTDITDSKGSVVGKITVATSVTVNGTGSTGGQIQLMDGSNNIGPVINIPTPGTTWNSPLTGLNPKAYSIKARPLYGTAVPDSDAKAFTVTALITPTLDSVKDPDVEIPEGTTTISTTLKLTGQASKDQKVEIYEGSGSGAKLKGEATADATTGIWTLTITVDPGDLRLYAKSLYHSSTIYSNVRTLKVGAPLVIDTRAVGLYGFFVTIGLPRTSAIPPNTTVTRQPTSGTPPYSYRSTKPGVAQVDANGNVVGGRNGRTTIEVSDSSGQTASYDVVRTQAWKIVTTPSVQGSSVNSWANAQGAAGSFNMEPYPDGGTMEALRTYYILDVGWNYRMWTGRYRFVNEVVWANPYLGTDGLLRMEDWLGAYCRIPDDEP